MKTILALTPGDPEGIGPEITWKAIQNQFKALKEKSTAILCVGAEKPFQKLKAPIIKFDPKSPYPPKEESPYIWLWAAPEEAPSQNLLREGYQQGWAIEKATELVLKGTAKALVTGPISKERLQKGGFLYPGHTEFLAKLCQVNEVTMMLANSDLRVPLVTTHLSIAQVPQALTRRKIERTVLQTIEGLRQVWGIQKPKLAVAALNPHAGESGLFGREEIEIIAPEVQSLQEKGQGKYEIIGPLPADTLFAKNHLAPLHERFDAVVCMYHDQGLIPVKLLDFRHTVNVTLGLPIIRTSVDHGVGFDIVGKGVADSASLSAAIELATQFEKD